MTSGEFWLDILKEVVKGGTTAGLGVLCVYAYNRYKDRRVATEMQKSVVSGESLTWRKSDDSTGFLVTNETPWAMIVRRVWVSLRDFSPQELGLMYTGNRNIPAGEFVTLHPFTSDAWGSSMLKPQNATKIKGVHVTVEYKSVFGTSKLLTVNLGQAQADLIRNSLLNQLQAPPPDAPSLEQLLPRAVF